ncbi:MAG: MBL fold metallo-hydrolase [Dehalococcoidia bacterium]|nr:MAG: MBL fold metallo-hydrolase [Dehalococcoidia bacterium]
MKLTKNLYFFSEKGMMDCNTYVIKDNQSLLIDPGLTQFLPALIEEMQRDGIDPKEIKLIANTHLHGDHCWANDAFKKLSGAEILLHPVQKQFGQAAAVQTSQFFGVSAVEFSEDRLMDNDKLSLGETEVELIPSPGHSPDSICYYCPNDKVLICGDVIFSQNTGRVDLPGGGADQLKASIERLSQLDIEYLLPGHMDIVVGKENVKNNFEFVKKYVLGNL